MPITQPRMMPKQMPAITYAIDSDFMALGVRTRSEYGRASPLGLRTNDRSSSGQYVQILAHAAIKPDEQGVTDQGMADRDLGEMRQTPEHLQIVEIQVVPGIDAKAETNWPEWRRGHR